MSPDEREGRSDEALDEAPDDAAEAEGHQGEQPDLEDQEQGSAPASGRSGDGFSRSAQDADKDAGGIQSMEEDEARSAISEAVGRQAVRAGVVKVAQFAPPVMERPEALQQEEERRQRIAERTQRYRAQVLAQTDDDQERENLVLEWAKEDALHYKAGPTDRELELYPVREPFSYVQIVRNERTHEMLYHVIEPMLDREEAVLLDFIEETLVDVLDMKPGDLQGEDIDHYIETKFDEVLQDYSIILGQESEEVDVPQDLLQEAEEAREAVRAAEAEGAGDGEAEGVPDAAAVKARQKEAQKRKKQVQKRIKQKKRELEKAAKQAQKEAKKQKKAEASEAKHAEKEAAKAAKKGSPEPAAHDDADTDADPHGTEAEAQTAAAEADDERETLAEEGPADDGEETDEGEDEGPVLSEDPEEASRQRLLYYVKRDFIGEGPLDVLMNDPMIEDISCDGPHVPIFVYHRGYEALTTTVRFRDHSHLDSFVIRLAQRAGKHVSIAEPILDATMTDGSRLQATLAREVSAFGSTFTIRKFKETPFTPIDLVRFGTMSPDILAYLWMVIEHHMSAIYAGGTASGKTTAINAIMLFIPPQNKVVTIEDTREIQIPQPNWIAGVTRGGFGPRDSHGRQAGEIDMFQLLKNALRQRPEYIIVGEVRGAEAYSLFQAMATGHAAYGTMHADSVDAVIHRLESDPINIPRSLLEALDVVAVQVQTRVEGKRVRRTKQVTEIVGLDPNTREILTNAVFHWVPGTDSFEYSGVSYALERIAAESGADVAEVVEEVQTRAALITAMVDNEFTDYKVVAHIITTYYKNKERIMEVLGSGDWDELLREAETRDLDELLAEAEDLSALGALGVGDAVDAPSEGGDAGPDGEVAAEGEGAAPEMGAGSPGDDAASEPTPALEDEEE